MNQLWFWWHIASEGRSDCASENRPDGGKIFWESQLEQCDNISVSNKWQIIISLWRPIYLHVHSTYVYNTIMRFIPKPLSEYSHSTTINLPVWPEFYITIWFFLDPGWTYLTSERGTHNKRFQTPDLWTLPTSWGSWKDKFPLKQSPDLYNIDLWSGLYYIETKSVFMCEWPAPGTFPMLKIWSQCCWQRANVSSSSTS